MSQPYRSMVIDAPIEKVWSVVRLFDGLPAWHPVIATSSLDSGEEGHVGAVRRLVTGDGGVITERLLSLDDESHRLVYTIIDSPFAVRRYVSTMHLAPVTDTGGTFMEWSAEFDSEAADEAELMTVFGDGVFGTGLTALREHATG
jgi:uncharacterized protein YndB with AHSA1/START domain